MSKPSLIEPDSTLEGQIIETMIAGLHEYRPDLRYPESHSNMSACVRGLLRMFEVTRRPIAVPLRIRCHVCKGCKELVEPKAHACYSCPECGGKGWLEG